MTNSTNTVPAWSVELQGRTYPLVPSLPALRGVERATGCTLFSLVEAGAGGGLTIDQLTSITACLAKVGDGDPLFGGVQMRALAAASAIAPGPGPLAEPLAGAIMEAGIVAVTSRVLVPLAAAMAGRVAPNGDLRATEG